MIPKFELLLRALTSLLENGSTFLPCLAMMAPVQRDDGSKLVVGFWRLVATMLVQLTITAAAVVAGVYVSQRLVEKDVASNAKAIEANTAAIRNLMSTITNLDDKQDTRWEAYQRDRVEDARRENGKENRR